MWGKAGLQIHYRSKKSSLTFISFFDNPLITAKSSQSVGGERQSINILLQLNPAPPACCCLFAHPGERGGNSHSGCVVA